MTEAASKQKLKIIINYSVYIYYVIKVLELRFSSTALSVSILPWLPVPAPVPGVEFRFKF